MTRLALLVVATLSACTGPPPLEVRFEPATATGDALRVSAPTASAARSLLLEALASEDPARPLAGDAPWETIAVLRGVDDTAAEATARGRTYVRSGDGDLRVDLRVGCGNVGTFSGGTVESGAERCMAQMRLADLDAPGARFRVTAYRDAGAGTRARDITPAYLRHDLPGGTYRIGFDVAPRGARLLLGVVEVDGHGGARAHAWASPITIRRPWL